MTDLGIPGLEEARFLASGGFGEVYVARQPALNREVAVKVLTAPVLDDVRRKRFDQECRALGALSEHPHIVSLYDAGYTNRERPYLLMPYLRAGSLADRLRSESVIPSGEVRDIGVKIAGALATAHRADVLHRDVKPANILVSEYGEPQLGDFGVARFVDESHTSTGAVTGTLAFTAPELFQGAAPSPSSDVYSLAASLFALISGRPPYAEDADAPLVRILARITSGPPATLAPGSCSSGLRDAIHAGMARDPAERPSDGEALGHLLESSDAAPADGATATMILMPSLSRAARRAAEEDTRVHSATNQEATTQLPSPKRSIAASAGLVVAVLLLLLLGAAFAVSRLGPHETLASGSVDPTDPAPRDAALDLADAEPTTSPTPAEEILAVPDVADAEPTTSPTPAEEILAVPDVRGKAPGVAGAELIRAGFTVQTQQRQDASVERQVVVSQRPDAGAERPAGAAITLVVAVPAPLEGVDAYVTTNGTQPQGAQTCPGVLGLCLSAPIDEAVNLLGTEDSRFGEQGTVTRQWAIADGEAFISVAADDIGSITQMTVAMNAITDVRVALPEGLLLGESRMGDVVDILGEPHDTAEDAAENFAFYDYIYRVGPEGSISYDFGYNAVIGSADDPGGINDALADKPVLSFTVDYPFDDF